MLYEPRILKITTATQLPASSNSGTSPSSVPSPSYPSSSSTFTNSPYSSIASSPLSPIKEKPFYTSPHYPYRWNNTTYRIKRALRRKSIKVLLLLLLSTIVIVCQLSKLNNNANWKYLTPRKPFGLAEVFKLYSLEKKSFDQLDVKTSSFSTDLANTPQSTDPSPYDPRIIAALSLFNIRKHLNNNQATLKPDFRIPFSWKDWIDLDNRLEPSNQWIRSGKPKGGFTCEAFSSQIKLKLGVFGSFKTCQNLNLSNIAKLPSSNYPHFAITGPDARKLPVEARIMYGASYLYHKAPVPERLLFLGTGLRKNQAFSILTTNEGDKKHTDDLIKDYLEFENIIEDPGEFVKAYEKGINIFDEVQKLHDELLAYDHRIPVLPDPMIQKDHSRLVGGNRPSSKVNHGDDDTRGTFNSVVLPPKEFKWDLRKLYHEMLEHIFEITSSCENSEDCDLTNHLDHKIVETIRKESVLAPNYPKYFFEANNYNRRLNGAHFDWRFFNVVDMNEYDRKSNLHRLIKAWLNFAATVNLYTWISHGTLLGYHFNGMMLDWDFDADVQVTQASLFQLARNYNQSLIVDVTTSNEDSTLLKDTGVGSYLLDVSPFFFDRGRGNGANVIDARFIDTNTGMYIDITALASSEQVIHLTRKNTKKEMKTLLAQNDRKETDIDDLYHCKNEHFYTHEEISPLTPTLFEGSLAYIPNKFQQILLREYPKYLNKTSQEGYTLRSKLNSWVSNKLCDKQDLKGTTCTDKSTMFEQLLTRDYIRKHNDQTLKITKDGGFRLPVELSPHTPALRVDNVLARIATYRMETMFG